MFKCLLCNRMNGTWQELEAYTGLPCKCNPMPRRLAENNGGCQPVIPLTEADVRRIVRDELSKRGST